MVSTSTMKENINIKVFTAHTLVIMNHEMLKIVFMKNLIGVLNKNLIGR